MKQKVFSLFCLALVICSVFVFPIGALAHQDHAHEVGGYAVLEDGTKVLVDPAKAEISPFAEMCAPGKAHGSKTYEKNKRPGNGGTTYDVYCYWCDSYMYTVAAK